MLAPLVQIRSRPVDCANEKSVVSLFTGAGGLDLGLEQAGFQTMFASDIDRWSMQTLDEAKIRGLAFKHAKLVAADVTTITAEMIRGHRPATWRPTVLAGGPPCQPFSSAGAQRGLADPRGQLFWEYLRLARDLRPDFLVFENVRGLVTARTPDGQVGGVLRRIVEEIQGPRIRDARGAVERCRLRRATAARSPLRDR